jgi:hypothetical protein
MSQNLRHARRSPAVILYGGFALFLVFAVALCCRSFRAKLRGYLSGLFLLRRIKSALLIGYACASLAALDLPCHRTDPMGLRHDFPHGFHFAWEYSKMGLDSDPVYGLVGIEELGILLGFAAAHKLALIAYDALT